VSVDETGRGFHPLTQDLGGFGSDPAAIQLGVIDPVHIDREAKRLNDAPDSVNRIGILVGVGKKNIVVIRWREAQRILVEDLRCGFAHADAGCLTSRPGF
jgi:hypothetical protein